MFEKLIEQWRPQAVRLGEQAKQYAEHMTHHLAVIADNTTADSDEITRSYIRNVVQANAVSQELFQVPTGQTWHLEAVTAVVAGGNAVFTLRNGPNGAPLFATNGSSPGTIGGSGVVFSSGMSVAIDNGANLVELTLQVRRVIRQPRRKIHTHAAGVFEQRPPIDPDESTERHLVANVTPVANVRGERAA